MFANADSILKYNIIPYLTVQKAKKAEKRDIYAKK